MLLTLLLTYTYSPPIWQTQIQILVKKTLLYSKSLLIQPIQMWVLSKFYNSTNQCKKQDIVSATPVKMEIDQLLEEEGPVNQNKDEVSAELDNMEIDDLLLQDGPAEQNEGDDANIESNSVKPSDDDDDGKDEKEDEEEDDADLLEKVSAPNTLRRFLHWITKWIVYR